MSIRYEMSERLRITSRTAAVLASCNHQRWEIPCSHGKEADWGKEKARWVFSLFLAMGRGKRSGCVACSPPSFAPEGGWEEAV